ncbi:MAG: hypothetical protein US30_C0006G0038 [Candidatus Moranbacteria bacterium GW2011_GWF2_36_839]|nr:MAG: hypothetical protein US27_C0006G0045 [Candidatus Moranbacteria bacterium GW2011_GWF1_36_78]KKQ17149.1 MAG: hypothetical protein US30_C0006G0038 [Candidatus Moranbacteria bacterium GW2011_GWF2_36_839]HAT74141.1 hypothetical protein [Candidatus Moranbacteria bacterium]HBY10651.1 hypothetical protein [Candidatus Moranbacteria bacterium]
MEQIMATQPAKNNCNKSHSSIIILCGLIALLFLGSVLGCWIINLKFRPVQSMFMDLRATEISVVQILDEYDAFRKEAPKDLQNWKESQHIRNGQLNLAIKELQHKYMRKIRAYNLATEKISDFIFAVGCKLNSVEIPKQVDLSIN